MTIGQLARAAGVPVSTVRFYERRKLILPAARSAASYRYYDADHVQRVRFIRRAQELGFGLAEIGLLLGFSRARVRRAELDRVGGRKLAELDARIADLRRVQRALRGLLAAPCFDPDAPCPIIAALAPAR